MRDGDIGVPGSKRGRYRSGGGGAPGPGRRLLRVLGRAQPVFSRIAIVNRGEAAMRLIHAVRDLSAETGTRIETVALYTDA
ncbi:MAG: biotin carboxylase N-terminal domain-containing protein, partial [Actinoplanes sp.]